MTTQPAALFTIPAGQAFLPALVKGITARWYRTTDDPFALTRVTLLLPTRRAVRVARSAFQDWAAQTGGGVVLLPRIQPIGDVDEDDLLATDGPTGATDLDLCPEVPDLRRRLILAQLIQRWQTARAPGRDRGIAPGQAARLARDLGAFLDEVQTAEADLAGLKTLAPDRFAVHWQHTVQFLSILTDAWPAVLDEQGVMDRQIRRARLIDALARRWEASPPTDPVIAAGSTGSVPATRRLLQVIAGLPEGAVVLPGLDRGIDSDVWASLEDSHPQYGLRDLLDAFERMPDTVPHWPGAEDRAPRQRRLRLINEALRPAGTTDGWLQVKDGIAPPEATRDLHRIDAATPAEEARAIALILRETLETPERSAALVTPDRMLARRVREELRRWRIDVDDSAGDPLMTTPPAVFLRLTANALKADFAPVPLLSLLKHPLCRLGLDVGRRDYRVGLLDRSVLRGLRPKPGLEGLKTALPDRLRDRDGAPLPQAEDLADLVDRLAAAFAPLTALADGAAYDLSAWALAHASVGEALARSEAENDGAERLWLGDAGDALAAVMAELTGDGSFAEAITVTDYPALFESLIETIVVRPARPRHPRLFIWGPLEARLQQTDVMILGSLNEGTWPDDPGADPWLSRPMRYNLGLPSPERRIGQAAHDFSQLCGAPTVYLTRAEKVDGTPQVPSRWLLRLENLLKGAGQADALAPSADYCALAQALDRPDTVARSAEPRPKPPVEHRPTSLSVTEIETLIRDPYAIYAKHVLRLRPLDPLDQAPGPRERGIFVHDLLERFVATHRDTLPDGALEALIAEGERSLSHILTDPAQRTFWGPRFRQAAHWFFETERAWREKAAPLAIEVAGSWSVPDTDGFTVTGRADRIDRLSGGYAIIDYKTGQPPSRKEVEAGLAPQLALEALMVGAGAFENVPAGPVAWLRYVPFKGGRSADKPGDIAVGEDTVSQLSYDAAVGLGQLIRQYGRPETPYRPRHIPKHETSKGDYDHLARVKEWSVDVGGDA
ncbi:MAG: double-strand break repair protein AddB [Alphaproteobacteria bacterium]